MTPVSVKQIPGSNDDIPFYFLAAVIVSCDAVRCHVCSSMVNKTCNMDDYQNDEANIEDCGNEINTCITVNTSIGIGTYHSQLKMFDVQTSQI